MYTNADCFSNKYDELVLFLRVSDRQPDIIVITEVNSKSMENKKLESEFSLDGYGIYSCNVGSVGFRGIIIYVRKDMVSSALDINGTFAERLFINVKDNVGVSFVIGAIYRSPSSSAENSYELCQLIDNVFKTISSPVVIVGDFNFPSIIWENNMPANEASSFSPTGMFIDCCNRNFLIQHVCSPTRVSGSQNPHILDLVITREDIVDSIEHFSPLGKSDHCILLVECKVNYQTRNCRKLALDRGNYLELSRYLCNYDFEECIDNDVEKVWESFTIAMTNGVSKYIPVSSGGNWRRKITWKQPVSENIRKLINRKHRLWTRYQETRSKEVLNAYKKIRNCVRSEIRKVSKQKGKEIARDCKRNPKKFWQYVKSKNKSPQVVGDLTVKKNGISSIVTMDSEKCEYFSDYFASIYSVENPLPFEQLPPRAPRNQMTELVIDQETVYRKLDSLKLNKSPGPDMLHPRVLFETRKAISCVLTRLFNLSLHEGTVPLGWKESIVSAIHKKGAKNLVENYRPISLTSVVCKIMESIIRDHIMDYFTSNNLFSDLQYGFIKGRSNTLQLLKVTDEWVNIIEDGGQVDVIYTDFEKAFDRVPHKRLLSKLYSYGIHDTIIKWIENFLSNRSQRVRVNDSLSDSKVVLGGIPQGSVLGPLLFIIYINDLPDVCNNLCSCFLFADDAKLYKHVKNLMDADTLNVCFNKVLEWSNRWLMKLNLEKCKVVSLNTKRNSRDRYSYGLKQQNQITVPLSYEESVKDLGVIVNSNLDSGDHIHTKITIARKILGLIVRNFKYLSPGDFIQMYKCLVRSHLEFGNSVWQPWKIGYCRELESVQKQATRCIRQCSNMAYPDRLKYLKLPTLSYRRCRGDMIEVYKILNKLYDPIVAPSLDRNLFSQTRGNSYKLCMRQSRLNLHKYSFCNRVVPIWNALPEYVVQSASLNSFKNNLDRAWANEEFLYNFEAKAPCKYKVT